MSDKNAPVPIITGGTTGPGAETAQLFAAKRLKKYLDRAPAAAEYENPATSTPEAIAPVIFALA